ncbi:MAG: general secretion pathway protein GspG, partial [Rhodocyclales bacterium CG17_big_fil_post_rev_8_21_14_2_50_68_7]
RSYRSPPDEPEEGDDVFDVFSTSEKQALDGSFYRDW